MRLYGPKITNELNGEKDLVEFMYEISLALMPPVSVDSLKVIYPIKIRKISNNNK
jgi:hypothetical protein